MSKKQSRLRKLRRLYIYRDVDLTTKYILPYLNEGKIPETRLTVASTYGDPVNDPNGDMNDCRIPINDYYLRFPREDLLHIISDSFFPPTNPKTDVWRCACANVTETSSNEDWAKEIVQITANFIPSLMDSEHQDARNFLENPWKIFQENDRKQVVLRSFSEDNNSQHMWKKFGDEGKGICIEYDVEQFLQRDYCKDDMKYLHPVLYSDSDADRLIPELTTPRNKLSDKEHLRQLTRSLLVKSTEYEPEHEWRFVYIPSYRCTPELFKRGVLQEISEENNKDYLPFVPCCIHLGADRDDAFADKVIDSVRLFNEQKKDKRMIDIDDSLYSAK